MKKANNHSLNPNVNGHSKDTKISNLKQSILKDTKKLFESNEIEHDTSEDILQKLAESIGQIDFMLLAFPKSAEVKREIKPLENKL